MKVEFKVGEIEAVASTDFVMPWGLSDKETATIKAAMFTKLANDAKAIAFKLIEAKCKKEIEVNK